MKNLGLIRSKKDAIKYYQRGGGLWLERGRIPESEASPHPKPIPGQAPSLCGEPLPLV